MQWQPSPQVDVTKSRSYAFKPDWSMTSFVYLCVIVSSIVLAVSVGLANGKGQYV